MGVVEGEAPHRESIGELWARQPDWVKRLIKTGVVLVLILGLGLSGQLKRSGQFWGFILVVVAAINWRTIRVLFWWGLEAVGVEDAKARWSRQSPLVRRAVPPVALVAARHLPHLGGRDAAVVRPCSCCSRSATRST